MNLNHKIYSINPHNHHHCYNEVVVDIISPMKVSNISNSIICVQIYHHPHHYPRHDRHHHDPHDNAAVVDITCPIKIASIPAPLSQP